MMSSTSNSRFKKKNFSQKDDFGARPWEGGAIRLHRNNRLRVQTNEIPNKLGLMEINEMARVIA